MQTVKYSIRKLFQEGGATRRIGRRSNPAVPLEGAYIPVQLPGESNARVAIIEDLFSDSPAFFLAMVKSKAFSIVPGTAVYNESDQLVSASVIWADGTPGEVEYNYTDANGSYAFTAAKTTGSAPTKTAMEIVTKDEYGRDIGTIIGEEGTPVTLVAQPLPFTAKQNAPVELRENTGMQKLTFTPLTKKVQIISEAYFEVSADGAAWSFFAEVDPAVSHDFYVRIKDTSTLANLTGKLHFQVEGTLAGECALTGHVGDGTVAYPYPVANALQLDDIRNGLEDNYKLFADIDLSSYGVFTPIGETFAGTFDGAGHEISNVSIGVSDTYSGLFAVIRGSVSNLTLTNCETGVTPPVNAYAGLLAGSLAGTVTDCILSGKVINPAGNSGGVCGNSSAAIITRVSVIADVIGLYVAGGLAAYLGGNATECSFVGKVSLDSNAILGARLGGLAGAAEDAVITDCVALADLDGGGQGKCGGIAYDLDSTGTGALTRCFFAGEISNFDEAYGIGSEDGNGRLVVNDCYWDAELSGVETDGNGATHLSTSDSKQKSSFPRFDFEEVWDIEDAESYPFLRWENAQ